MDDTSTQYTHDEVAGTEAFQVIGELEIGFSPDVEGKIDSLLLETVAETKTAKVPAGQARPQTARAWSFGGSVD